MVLYDLADFQGHLITTTRVIGVKRSNFDLEYLGHGMTYDLEVFILGDLR